MRVNKTNQEWLKRSVYTQNLLQVTAFFYKSVDLSEESDYMFSQIGFNDKKLDKSFDEGEFLIMKKYFSPSKVLKGLNSKAF